MADKYTIQIQPQIGASDALKMEQDLNRRFSNVAKKFGSNLGNSIKNVTKIGLATAAAGIVATIATNPFEKISENLNNITAKADEIATRANQFGVTTAKFAELQSVAKSVGLDSTMALQQFQDMLQEAKLFKAGDATKSNALVNFLNEKDLIEAFYAFAKSMNNLQGNERSAEVSRVFGNKLESRISEFLQIPDLEARKKQTRSKGVTAQAVGSGIDSLAAKEDIQALNRVKLENDLFLKGARAISNGTMNAQAQQERQKMLREVSQLSQFEIFANLATTQERMATSIDGIRADVTALLLPLLQRIVDGIEWIVGWVRDKIRNLKKFNPFD